MPIAIDVSYWAFAFTQSLLMLTAPVACVLNIVWYFGTRVDRPPLRNLLLFVALLHATLAVEATKWVVDRALDPFFAVNILTAFLESRTYWQSALVRGAFLTIVALMTFEIWRVRRLGMARFVLLGAALVLLAGAATSFHAQQIDAYCRDPPGCRID